MIEHLLAINDLLIEIFKENELRPIKESTFYHSPEVSETDNDNSGKRKLVTKDLEWRSTAVRINVNRF